MKNLSSDGVVAEVAALVDAHGPGGVEAHSIDRSSFGRSCYSKEYSAAFDWRKQQVMAGLLEQGREHR